ncbi:Murein DD-endopeptidase MepM and murein hydrolase activator NlpD, contain LysM domain [Methylobacterium phyllostachyos]|uniref:Murein DD-endopeptidase MepM and murein hydrolase activator NlpD, contain LysM domain n=1 Tax=Methylobacterium phyllostachyos TaxID=582672 RepID=A0A1H0LMC4_9HYPH|nr:M23 family metallopeptidase [Methylobacterium phyllostachyos]SDO69372.1 Murein DD-endopeptidase MepM and murein hydrolase activator NlpD, contain LysM domain [Methylobacterium phyllostachyos]
MKRERTKIGDVAAFSGRGLQAPLDHLGSTATHIDRRAVNLRWLFASTLTGLTGAGLIAAALHVSLQGDASFAAIPERVTVIPRPQPSESGANLARKGDRLVRNLMIASAKQSFRAPVTVRLGDREIIKAKSFVRLSTPLSMTTGVYAGEPPRFDPMKFVSDEPLERAPDVAADAPSAEVTVVKRDLADASVDAGAPALTDDDVTAQVEEERRIASEAGRRAAIPIAPQIMLSRTLQQGAASDSEGAAPKDANPFKSIEVLVVPENVTKVAKTELKPNDVPLVEERDLALKRGETLESMLKSTGFAGDEAIHGIVAALGGKARTAALNEGQPMRVQIAPGPRPGDSRQVTRVVLYGEAGIEGIAALNDRGSFVSVAPPAEEAPTPKPQPQAEASDDEDADSGSGPRLYQSLYETAARHDLPRATVEDIVRVFSYDLDFQRRIASGDGLDVFYTYDDEASSDRPDLLYAALTLGGETHKVYRFQSPDDGTIDYLDDQGRSLKKFLLRKPIADGIMRSGFGYRRHPVLGYAKLHTGVDWANPIGTPIMAAGNGVVIRSEMTSGYGNRVELQHVNGYVTTYNHMSRFGRGIREGVKVRQGQVIGYVGSTGLSTGAHLHYEVIINGHFVDPMKIRVPRGRELDGRLLAEFKRQREQIDATMQKSKSATALAQRDAIVR